MDTPCRTTLATTSTSRSRATEPRCVVCELRESDSNDLTQITGQYSVVLPDCRIQTVTYSVRPETGFVVRLRTDLVTRVMILS